MWARKYRGGNECLDWICLMRMVVVHGSPSTCPPPLRNSALAVHLPLLNASSFRSPGARVVCCSKESKHWWSSRRHPPHVRGGRKDNNFGEEKKDHKDPDPHKRRLPDLVCYRKFFNKMATLPGTLLMAIQISNPALVLLYLTEPTFWSPKKTRR